MKELKEDQEIKKILVNGLLEKAPVGMVDRIMATIAVSPARRLTTRPIEPKPFMATLVPILTGILVAIAAFIKPDSRFSISWDRYLNLNINPIWVAPILIIALTIWGYIYIASRNKTVHK